MRHGRSGSTSTGERGEPEKKRRDRRSRRGVQRYQWGQGCRLDRLMGHSNCLRAGTGPLSISMRVIETWCSPGATTLEFDAVFRRTCAKGVVLNVSPVIKVRSKKTTINIPPGVIFQGGGYSRGVCCHPCDTVYSI